MSFLSREGLNLAVLPGLQKAHRIIAAGIEAEWLGSANQMKQTPDMQRGSSEVPGQNAGKARRNCDRGGVRVKACLDQDCRFTLGLEFGGTRTRLEQRVFRFVAEAEEKQQGPPASWKDEH